MDDIGQENTSSRLPYVIAIIGLIASVGLWFFLNNEHFPAHYLDFVLPSLPLISLIIGVLLSILAGIIIRLVQLSHERVQSYRHISDTIKREIAKRAHIEESKQQLERALLQGQKLQAMGTLAGGIAHDFNNLLYAIIGYVEMAREDVPRDSLVYKNLGKVLEASHRGQELISRILAFSRRQHHELKPLSLRKTIENALALLKPTIPASADIELVACEQECLILGDQTQLHQVLVNVINNAVDAMDGEGTITIKLSHVLSTSKFLQQFPQLPSKNYCKIEIKDTGHGMDPTTLERIFEPFFTTKEVGKGTGLGLSTVHAIVKEYQGEILVKSQLGHGTVFTILLPEYQ